MAFNLEDYETVETRLEKWHGKFPDNRIETELIEASNTRFIVFCKLFKTEADPKPCATGLAFETISYRFLMYFNCQSICLYPSTVANHLDLP